MCSKRPIPIADLINLAQKRAIVAGGATGIGFAISHRLAEAGATVAERMGGIDILVNNAGM